MKKILTLRSLILLSFAIFALPFFNMCSTLKSDEVVLENTVEVLDETNDPEVIDKPSDSLGQTIQKNDVVANDNEDTNTNNDETEYDKILAVCCPLDKLNGYCLVFFTFTSVFPDKNYEFLLSFGIFPFILFLT